MLHINHHVHNVLHALMVVQEKWRMEGREGTGGEEQFSLFRKASGEVRGGYMKVQNYVGPFFIPVLVHNSFMAFERLQQCSELERHYQRAMEVINGKYQHMMSLGVAGSSCECCESNFARQILFTVKHITEFKKQRQRHHHPRSHQQEEQQNSYSRYHHDHHHSSQEINV